MQYDHDDRDLEPTQAEAEPIEVPIEALSSDVLTRIIEEFVLREGTDYGASEVSLEAKVEQVHKQPPERIVKHRRPRLN